MSSRNTNLRQSLPKELQPSSKLTDKRFQFVLPSVESRMNSTQPYSRSVSVHEKRRSYTGLSGHRSPQKSRSASRSASSSSLTTPHSQSRSNSSRGSQNSSKQQTILDDETCISLRQKYIGQENPNFDEEENIDDLKLLLEHLKVYTLSEASKGNYEEGRKSEKLTQELNNYIYHAVHDKTKSTSPRTQFEQEYKQKQQEWEKELNDFDDETARKNQELQDQHEQELNEFNDKWGEGEYYKYRKPSSKLLNLWRMEKFLAKQKKLDEAERIHNEAEQLSKRETEQAKKALDRDYQTQLQKLKEKQAAEIEQMNLEREAERKFIQTKQSKEKDCYTNKGNVIEYRLKEPPRTKEAQKSVGTRGSPKKKQYAAPEVSFAYQTILPPLQPPCQTSKKKSGTQSEHSTGRNTPNNEIKDSKNNSQKGTGNNSPHNEEEPKLGAKEMIQDAIVN